MRLIDKDKLMSVLNGNWLAMSPKDADSEEVKAERNAMCMGIDYAFNIVGGFPEVGGWISVKDKLPENAKHPNAFCPRYLIYTDYGITEGWYNPNKECWYGFLTFMTDEFEVWNIDLERGDIPKRVKNIPVKYWMPLPEPPKEDA